MSMVLIIVVLFLELPNVKPKIGCLNLNKIWGKVRTNILKHLIANQSQTKCYKGNLKTDSHDNGTSNKGFHYIYPSMILIVSVLIKDKNYHLFIKT